ncbi:putative ATP-binding cassette sub-family D member 4 [Quillaja saponaria]|uniref:ATP-binding cassette sub-family D member 4 n=1 Tax=Quillaja saponaria TaxID=32244 RepID=A0AAD7LE37_QUISA|nr:putative ATP-binding cassette sub-family D member 4 [Quillaja saponaria]
MGDNVPSLIRLPPASVEIPEKAQPVSPIVKINIQHNGSELYDSFELRAMTHQLNKAIHGSRASSPAYLKSPIYQHHLDRLYRGNAKSPRRILYSQNKKECEKGTRESTRGFMSQLWMKVKQGLLRKKQKADELNKTKRIN